MDQIVLHLFHLLLEHSISHVLLSDALLLALPQLLHGSSLLVQLFLFLFFFFVNFSLLLRFFARYRFLLSLLGSSLRFLWQLGVGSFEHFLDFVFALG